VWASKLSFEYGTTHKTATTDHAAADSNKDGESRDKIDKNELTDLGICIVSIVQVNEAD
jgi:hypothetical protein